MLPFIMKLALGFSSEAEVRIYEHFLWIYVWSRENNSLWCQFWPQDPRLYEHNLRYFDNDHMTFLPVISFGCIYVKNWGEWLSLEANVAFWERLFVIFTPRSVDRYLYIQCSLSLYLSARCQSSQHYPTCGVHLVCYFDILWWTVVYHHMTAF